jgi:hypothetical protein
LCRVRRQRCQHDARAGEADQIAEGAGASTLWHQQTVSRALQSTEATGGGALDNLHADRSTGQIAQTGRCRAHDRHNVRADSSAGQIAQATAGRSADTMRGGNGAG